MLWDPSYTTESAIIWEQQADKAVTAITFQLNESNFWNLTLK